MRILNKHLVKKTFKGIAFYKIESTSIEKKEIAMYSSDQIPNFESTNPDFLIYQLFCIGLVIFLSS